jgi:hypothetical protein
MTNGEAFVVMQIGDKGTPERKRADEIYNYVVTPVLRDVGIRAYRADLDPTLIESLVSNGKVSEGELEAMVSDSTPQAFNDWVEARRFEAREKAPSGWASSGSQFSDEPPF